MSFGDNMGVNDSLFVPALGRIGACSNAFHHSVKLSRQYPARSTATAWRLLFCGRIWPTTVRSEPTHMPISGQHQHLRPLNHTVLLTSRDARPNVSTIGRPSGQKVKTTRFDPAPSWIFGWSRNRRPFNRAVLATPCEVVANGPGNYAWGQHVRLRPGSTPRPGGLAP